MITPTFSIQQNEEFIIITIRAPFAKISETEIEYSEDLFVFSSPPYFLRIHLPKHVIYDDRGTANYDADSGSFTVNCPKLNKGEHFPDLDMITELLRPQMSQPSAKRLVEEIDDSDDEEDDSEEYYLEQNPEEISMNVRDADSCIYGYGFGWRRVEVIEKLRGEIGKILDGEPEIVKIADRAESLYEYDSKHFEIGHYLADTLEPTSELEDILSAKYASELSINEDDRNRLKELPARKLPKLSPKEKEATLWSLVDIIFAWAYDQRINDWEESCESGWTITKLSASLSYLMRWNSLEEAIIGSVRRSICYPLYRNFNLSKLVFQDVKTIFSKGKAAVLHILCSIMKLMISSSDFRYIFNDLLLTDLCMWLQTLAESDLIELSEQLNKLTISKELIGFDLDVLETQAKLGEITVNELDSDDEIL